MGGTIQGTTEGMGRWVVQYRGRWREWGGGWYNTGEDGGNGEVGGTIHWVNSEGMGRWVVQYIG